MRHFLHTDLAFSRWGTWSNLHMPPVHTVTLLVVTIYWVCGSVALLCYFLGLNKRSMTRRVVVGTFRYFSLFWLFVFFCIGFMSGLWIILGSIVSPVAILPFSVAV